MPVATSIAPDLSARRNLGVAWMNRGHALLLAENFPAALQAYEDAIDLLRPLRSAAPADWANSLGAALMNRGHLLHRLHGTARAADALASFSEAAAILRPLPAGDPSPWPARNLAGTLINRANLLLDLAQFFPASDAAMEALALASPSERADPVDAELALKARRARCDALGQLLITPGADQDALAHEAGDLTEAALTLIREWQSPAFQELAVRFFHYGVRLYRSYQPHFLAEFITEHRSLAGPATRTIALEAVDHVLAARDTTILIIDDPATERHLRTWRELEILRPALLT